MGAKPLLCGAGLCLEWRISYNAGRQYALDAAAERIFAEQEMGNVDEKSDLSDNRFDYDIAAVLSGLCIRR